jgi:hypothetical protein
MLSFPPLDKKMSKIREISPLTETVNADFAMILPWKITIFVRQNQPQVMEFCYGIPHHFCKSPIRSVVMACVAVQRHSVG